MKQRFRNVLTALLLLFIHVVCYSQSTIVKKVPNFKQVLGSIDTLALLPPFVDVKSVDNENKFQNDTVASQILSRNISTIITELLKKKYSLINLPGSGIVNSDVSEDFNRLLTKLYNTGKLPVGIDFPDSLCTTGNDTGRYCLISIVSGYYPTRERIKKDTREAISVGIAVAVLTMGHFYMTPNVTASIVLRIILYDRVEKKVLFFKLSNLSNTMSSYYFDDDINADFNQSVKFIYKPLYYK